MIEFLTCLFLLPALLMLISGFISARAHGVGDKGRKPQRWDYPQRWDDESVTNGATLRRRKENR